MALLGSIEEKSMALNGYSPEERRKLGQLLDEHYALLLGMVAFACRKHGHQCGLAERDDFCQGIYVSLRENDCERLCPFKYQCSFKTFLQQAVLGYVGHALRNRWRWVSWEDEKLDPLSNEVSAEESLLAESCLEGLFTAARQLPKRNQEVFWLLWEGLSEEEIAERMKVKIETVYSYKSEMIDKLQALLEGETRAGLLNWLRVI